MKKKLNIFRYIGGKYYIADWISGMLDYSKTCYIELFGGSGAVLLNKKPHKVEIFNDANDLLVNFFIQLVNNKDALLEKLQNLPYSEKIYYEFRKALAENKINSDLDKAVAFFYLHQCSFNGKGEEGNFTYGFAKPHNKAYYQKRKKFDLFYQRLTQVQFLCRDYRDILESIKDKEDIMLYADPPYFGTEHYYCKGDKKVVFTEQDHYILAEYLNQAKYSVAISYYEFDGIENLYPKSKWNYYYKKQVKYSYGIVRQAKQQTKPQSVELLILNYSPPTPNQENFQKLF